MNLLDKHNIYLELIKSAQDEHGFILSDECDSLLFTGLVGSVPKVKVDIDAAFDKVSQRWMRRPIECPCYPIGAASTISRDMLIGLAWYTYFNKRLDISEQIIKYALSHWCIMGEAATLKDKFGRCFLSPGLLATYAEISYRLGGPNRWWLRWLPQYESPEVVGFESHLSVLHIILRKKLTNSSKYDKLLKMHSERQPNNALFQVAVGNKNAVETILRDSRLFPEDRLPTSKDRVEQYLFQRDEGSDWLPDLVNPEKVHSGLDFMITYFLLNNY